MARKGSAAYFLVTGLSVLFLGLGIYFLGLSSAGKRESDVSQYDAISLEWTNVHRETFSNLGSFWYTTASESVLLSAVTDGDPLADWGDDIVSYVPLRYEETGLFTNATHIANFTIVLSDSNQSLDGTHALASAPISVALVRTTVYPSVKKSCAFQGGKWLHGRCAQKQFATKICVVVPLNFEEQTSTPFKGCYKGEGDEVFARYQVAGMRSLQVDPSLEATILTLRSSHDPYITAREITHNTMSFGMSAGQEVGLGVLFLIMGIFALSVPLGRCILARRARKPLREEQEIVAKVRQGQRHSDDHHDGGFGGVGFEAAGDIGHADHDDDDGTESSLEDLVDDHDVVHLDLGASLRA